jgi:hypothetical protein
MIRVLLAATVLALTTLPIAALPAAAHHGWSSYDSSAVRTMTGTVQEFSFTNPHAMLMLQADGKVWHVVLAPPSRMSARGLPEGTVKAGQTVTVEGYPSKVEPTEMRAERIRVGDRSVELR